MRTVLTVPHPSVLTEWADDMKQWPDVSYIDIVNYLVFSEGVDGGELCNYKSTEAYNYLHSNKIRKVLLKKQQVVISEGRWCRAQGSGRKYAWNMNYSVLSCFQCIHLDAHL